MILGVIAQEKGGVPKGTVLLGLVVDDDNVLGPVILGAADFVLRPGVVTAPDSVFGGDTPHTLSPDLFAGLRGEGFGELILAPRIGIDQRLFPLLYTSADIVHPPDIRFPGILAAQILFVDDEATFIPLVLCPGSFSVQLYDDLDRFFTPGIAAHKTMFPALLADADAFFTQLARIGLGPPFFLSDDRFLSLNSTSYYRPSRVIDDGRPVTPMAVFDPTTTNGANVSADGLTVTRTFQGSFYGARSAMTFSTGKFYFEVTVGETHGEADGLGIARPTTTYQNMVGRLFSTTVSYYGGIIFSNNNATEYAIGTLTKGDVVAVAIDLDNQQAWFRKNGESWNGTVAGHIPVPPPDPAIALGGVHIETASGFSGTLPYEYAPVVFFGGLDNRYYGQPGDFFVGNFGQRHFVMMPPANFAPAWQIPSPFPASTSGDTFGISSIGTPATLDATPDGASLSNGNLTATKTTSFFGTGAAWSASSQNWGKFYFEVTVDSTHGLEDFIGITMNDTDSFHTTEGGSYVTINNLGQMFSQGIYSGRYFNHYAVAGDVYGVAVDLTDQTPTYGGSIWFRLNGGPWNGQGAIGDTSPPADPTIRITGIKMSGYSYGERWYPAVGFGGSNALSGDRMTANFGATPFFSPQPEGYSFWPTKILEVIQAWRAVDPATLNDDLFPVPFLDTSLKVLRSFETVDAADIIYGGTSFGGNLACFVNTVVQEPDTIFAPGIYGLFAAGFESPNVTLSNGFQTATQTSAVNNSGARSVNFKSTGRYYFEITQVQAFNNDGAGLLQSTGTYTNMVSDGTKCVVVFVGGNALVYSNGAYTGRAFSGGLANGSVLGFAIDLNLRLGWIRKGNGPWNNDATTNPVTNIGGFAIGPGAFAPAVGFNGGGAGDSWVVNFGRTAFANPAPSGFALGWPAGSEVGVSMPGLVFDNDVIPVPFIQNQNQVLTHATLFTDADIIRSPKVPAGLPATFDGTPVNVTLSNGNKTATHSAIGSADGARSTTQKATSKFYFEVTVGATHGASDGAGILQTTSTFSDLLSGSNCFLARLSTGGIYGGNFQQGSVGPIVAGDILGFAVDFDAQPGYGRGWVSKNGGLWNGSATDNPATGSGGSIYVSGGFYVPAVAFGGGGAVINDAMTINCGPTFLNANANPAGFADWVIVAPATLATFDGIASNVALSNGSLTATHSNTTNNSGARSTFLKSTGKFYFEVTMSNVHGDFDCCGILLFGGSYTDFVTNGTSCVATYKNNGNIFSNNANSGRTLGAIASGDVIGVAVDLATRKSWLRKNGGNWNGLAIGSENPATGLGGTTIQASGLFGPAVGFGGTGTATNDAMTANFGGTTFAAAAPSGFTNWTAG